MDVLLTPLLAFTNHIDIVHVLALNLIGWSLKGCMRHHNVLSQWHDTIPVGLAGFGILLATIDPGQFARHPIIQGLAEAGMAWVLHQGIKRTPERIKKQISMKQAGDKVKEVTQGVTQKIKSLGGYRAQK